MQHAYSEEAEVSLAIHLAFEQFEARNLAFHLSVRFDFIQHSFRMMSGFLLWQICEHSFGEHLDLAEGTSPFLAR